ncbi:MAG: sensor histidine kinase [Thiohalospira sp.]
MVSKKFYIHIIIRIILILFNCLSIVPFIFKEEKLFTIFGLGFLLLLQIFLLLQYINKFNRNVADFFASLKTNDASYAFHDKVFSNIDENFRNNIEHVRNQLFNITERKEIQQSYFKTVIDNTQTAIITVGENGKIDIINQSALKLLNINRISNIKAIENIHPEFYQLIQHSGAGTEKMVIIKSKNKAIPVAVRISEFKQKDNQYKIVSFQDIESELNEKELLSWQKLIRVLTHEINNSISPIASLAKSLEKIYAQNNHTVLSKNEISEEIIHKTTEGLNVISNRSEGLMGFVNNFKLVASLKEIDPEKIKVAELFYNLELLMKDKLSEKNIDLQIEIIPIDLEVKADKKYIEQIFINLIKNSMEAITGDSGKIKLSGYKTKNGKTVLEIKDNGKGIAPELKDQIFIPFFTTKENLPDGLSAEQAGKSGGSGIGLSLTRQIMHLHGGSVSVKSTPNVETVFTLQF